MNKFGCPVHHDRKADLGIKKKPSNYPPFSNLKTEKKTQNSKEKNP